MPRRPRLDVIGSIQHVTNRGLARRPVFQSADDIRFLLACVARTVARGEIEVFAFTVLTTHFHFLVRCLVDGLARPFGWTLNQYVRRYNRRARRDGPLFRGRFRSTPVTSDAHWRLAIPYIDQNAVQAGLASRSIDYPWSSAWHYARDSGPPWLQRRRIESEVCVALGLDRYDPSRYREAVTDTPDADIAWLLERRVDEPPLAPDELDDLVAASPERVREWMQRKSHLADARAARVALAPPGPIHRAVAELRSGEPDWMLRPAKKAKSGWVVLESALLHVLSGLGVAEIRQWVNASETGVHRALHDHALLLANDVGYAERAARIASDVFRATADTRAGDAKWEIIRRS
jgi:REP element-mobilizing transposase RayT